MKSKKILVIEDNTDVRENIIEILELAGYSTEEAENGKIGVSKALECKPDLILCDVMMPELDGFGVLKIVNMQEGLMHVPFMFLTAKVEKNDFRKGMGLGADDYITKPFDDVELLEAIEIRLKKSESISRIENNNQGLKQFYDIAKGEQELNSLSKNRETRKYKTKDIIYEINQFPRWIFFVQHGQVKTYKTNEFGKELITKIYGQGEFFGFIPILNVSKYDDYAVVLDDCELSLVPPSDFHLLLSNSRDFAAKFIRMLAHHADYTEKQLIDLAYSSVRKKVANALLVLSSKSADGIVQVMRDDLAALAGTAKETTVRTLSDFKSESIIKIEDNQIHILDQHALEQMPQ